MPDTILPEVFRGIDPPFYVRSVERLGHWTDALGILNKVFPVDEDGTISIWRIGSNLDLIRVAVALNANRAASNPKGASWHESLHFVAIRGDDVGTIELRQTDGLTGCLHANSCHYGAVIERESQREGLVNALLIAGEEPRRLTKGKMKKAVKASQDAGCHAVVENSAKCACET